MYWLYVDVDLTEIITVTSIEWYDVNEKIHVPVYTYLILAGTPESRFLLSPQKYSYSIVRLFTVYILNPTSEIFCDLKMLNISIPKLNNA